MLETDFHGCINLREERADFSLSSPKRPAKGGGEEARLCWLFLSPVASPHLVPRRSLMQPLRDCCEQPLFRSSELVKTTEFAPLRYQDIPILVKTSAVW